MQDTIAAFEDAGISILAISVDRPETAAKMRDAHKLTFPLLSDVDAAVIMEYDVQHPLLILAKPAVFVLDSEDVIRWVQVGVDKADRAPTDEVLAAALAAAIADVEPTPRAVSAANKTATTWARIKARD